MVEKSNKIMLSGTWQLVWQDTGNEKIKEEDVLWKEAVACQVPGDVHVALTEAGVIADPLVDENSKLCRWMEEKEFWYKTEFIIETGALGEVTELVFEGLDLTADIWLNGTLIGSHKNAFVEKVLPVTDLLVTGRNVLMVRIDDGVYGVRDKSVDFMEHSWNKEQPYRAWMRKPQFVYGWDWTIWLPSCGIWKDVYLCTYDKAAIRNCYIQNRFSVLPATSAESVELDVEVELEGFTEGVYNLRCELERDPRYEEPEVIVTRSLCKELRGEETVVLTLPIERPNLWWPNGAGKPYLYQVTLILEDEKGNVLDRKEIRHGVRTVEICETPLEADTKSFTFVINGTPIFAKGANHVPADCFPGRITTEKNQALLQMAADCNMNMIRVWGGGIYESEGFMDACDSLGLMVWHDFMFACAYYPDFDEEFYREIETEATLAIKRLRTHSSLVGWSGNNEIQEMYHSVKSWNKEHPWYGGRIYEELLPALVEKLCPDRIYRESSPYGGTEPAAYEMGDQHTWHFTHRPQWEHYLDLWRFTDFDFKFLSEFGIIGAMNLESAEKCLSPDSCYRNSPAWIHHTNTSSNHELLDIFAEKYFGNADRMTLEEFILHSQVLQGEMMRHVYDELRTRKFRCSGVLLWTLSDSYGIHNWSVIDYYLKKRPIYDYMKRSLAPVSVTFRGYEVQTFDGMAHYREDYKKNPVPVELWVVNDQLTHKNVQLSYRVITWNGRVLQQGSKTVEVPCNGVKKALEVPTDRLWQDAQPEETCLVASLWEDGKCISENRYFFAPYKELKLSPAQVTVELRSVGEDVYEADIYGDTFVWMLHFATPDGIEVSDNNFDLYPGEHKKIQISCKEDLLESWKISGLNPSLKVHVLKSGEKK